MAIVVQQTSDGNGGVIDTPYTVYSNLFPAAAYIVNPTGMAELIAANVPSTQWTLSGTAAAPVVSQLATSDYNAQLLAYQIQACQNMGLAVSNYIESRYPDRVERSLGFLYSDGIAKNQPAVISAVQSAWNWTVSVIQGYYWYQAQVMACTTIPQVDACALNLQAYNATDPKVSMDSVLALQGLQVAIAPPTT